MRTCPDAPEHEDRQGAPSQAARAPTESTQSRARSTIGVARALGAARTRSRPSGALRGGPTSPFIDCRSVRFEKWQALGNDYLIVEASELPFDLTPERIKAICASHTGVSADGILLLSRSSEHGYLARLRIFNPDGSEAEVSGNGAREAVLYMRNRGWADSDSFTIQTAAGELQPTITSATTCTVQMGSARLRSEDYPSGPDGGRGEL